MKGRIVILVIWLAAISVNIGWAQAVVYDRTGYQWTCRTPGPAGTTYTKTSTQHNFDIVAAKKAGETHDTSTHDAICIDLVMNEQITWSWAGANHVKVVNFVPLTKDNGTCQKSNQPFTPAPDSGTASLLPSGPGDSNLAWCAYDVKFQSSKGPYDPHIIITGSKATLVKALRERVAYLEDVIHKLELEGGKSEK